MTNAIRLLSVLIVMAFLAGCWDERELKNIRMAHTVGIDLLEDGRVSG